MMTSWLVLLSSNGHTFLTSVYRTSALSMSKVFNDVLSGMYNKNESVLKISQMRLTPKQVWRCFGYHALLCEWDERDTCLELPDSEGGGDSDRLKGPMEMRNRWMIVEGQEYLHHACHGCEIFEDNGRPDNSCACCGLFLKSCYSSIQLELDLIRAITMDGLSIGRVCCAQHNCSHPLLNHHQRFCIHHQELNSVCAFEGCSNAVQDGCLTCSVAEHREAEEAHRANRANSSYHQKVRIRRWGKNAAESKLAQYDDLPDNLVEEPSGKSETGNRKGPKHRFRRHYTHNEQLIVSTCGVILSRATFYGAEGSKNSVVCSRTS
jgi:hypothetical protein